MTPSLGICLPNLCLCLTLSVLPTKLVKSLGTKTGSNMALKHACKHWVYLPWIKNYFCLDWEAFVFISTGVSTVSKKRNVAWYNLSCLCILQTLWSEFDCPEVTLCGWQDIKIQMLTYYCHFSTIENSSFRNLWCYQLWQWLEEGGHMADMALDHDPCHLYPQSSWFVAD